MTFVQEHPVGTQRLGTESNDGVHIGGIHWGAVVAGAVAAAALSCVLLAFGSGVGLAISSGSPTWQDTSTVLWVVSGAFLIFIALSSFGLGGYVAGRMRARIAGAAPLNDMDFRDGMHGLLSWALAILIGAVLAVASAQVVSRAAVPGGGQAGPATSVTGETTLAYELDELFRPDRASRGMDMSYARAEASRILLTSSRRAGVSPTDRDYLAQMVTMDAGVPPQEAQDRVTTIIPQAHDALKLARESGILIAFITAAALMIGVVVAWFGAREGGREREIGSAPAWNWSLRSPRHDKR
ncbi:MAG TPA: hypothetical protein VII49_04315 [Rhizomicrobium sp.]